MYIPFINEERVLTKLHKECIKRTKVHVVISNCEQKETFSI